MISLRSLFTFSAVAALALPASGCGDLSSNPITRALSPGSANADGKVGCTGNACKSGDIDARVLLDKSGNAIIVVHTGAFDPATSTAAPNGYFQTLQYKVYNASGKQVLVHNVTFKSTGVTVYSAPIPLCGDNDADDDDNGTSTFASCSTHYGTDWKVSVQANLKGVGGDDKKTDVVREDAVNGFLPDIDLSAQPITVNGVATTGVPAGTPVRFTVTIPNTKPAGPNGPGLFPVQTACVVTVDNVVQLAVPNVVVLGHATNPNAFSYVTGPTLDIPANGYLPCTFNLTLPEGPHTIVVSALPVIPGDFDYSNNSTKSITITATNQPTDIAAGNLLVDFLDKTAPATVGTKPILAGQTVQLDQWVNLLSGAAPSGPITCTATVTTPDNVTTTLTGTANGVNSACKLQNYQFVKAGTYTYSATVQPTDGTPANNSVGPISIVVTAPAQAVTAAVNAISLVATSGNIVLPGDTVVHSGDPVTYSASIATSEVGGATTVTCHAFVDGQEVAPTWVGSPTLNVSTTTPTTQQCQFKYAITDANTSQAGNAHTIGVQLTTSNNLINLAPPGPGQGTASYSVAVNVATRLDISASAFTMSGQTATLSSTAIAQGGTANFQTTITGPIGTQVNCGTLAAGPNVQNPSAVATLTMSLVTSNPVTLTNGTAACVYKIVAPSNQAIGAIPLVATATAVTSLLDPTPLNNVASGTLNIVSNGAFTTIPNPVTDPGLITMTQSWTAPFSSASDNSGLGLNATGDYMIDGSSMNTQNFQARGLALLVIPTSATLGTFQLDGTIFSGTTALGDAVIPAATLTFDPNKSTNCIVSAINSTTQPLVGTTQPSLVYYADVCAEPAPGQPGFVQVFIDVQESLSGPVKTTANPVMFNPSAKLQAVLKFTLDGSTVQNQVSATVTFPVDKLSGGCTDNGDGGVDQHGNVIPGTMTCSTKWLPYTATSP